MESEKYKECTRSGHITKGCPYPQDKIPIELFIDKYGKECKCCYYCRKYSADKSREPALNRPEYVEGMTEYYCTHVYHQNRSKIPRDRVPIEMFRLRPEDPSSFMFKECSDCRNSQSGIRKNLKNGRRQNILQNQFLCSCCGQIKDLSDRGINLSDGTTSIYCKKCKKRDLAKGRKRRQSYKKIKSEFVEKIQSCCELCESVYIKTHIVDIDHDYKLERINTFEIDGDRYFKYLGYVFKFSDFYKYHKDRFELDILELDHLTEAEQRKRGILKEGQKYEPKRNNVSDMGSEFSMRKEARKCQLLCIRCHRSITLSREQGCGPHASKENQKRIDHVAKLKNDFGCVKCGYNNIELLRFFELNHKNPKEKITTVNTMSRKSEYTTEQFYLEVAKCEILCSFCHVKETKRQRALGIISNIPRNFLSNNN